MDGAWTRPSHIGKFPLWVMLRFVFVGLVGLTGPNSPAEDKGSLKAEEIFVRPEVFEDAPSVFKTPMWKRLKESDELAANGNWRQAEIAMLEMLRVAPDNAFLMERLARIQMIQGKWLEAHDQWNFLFSKNSDRFDALTQMGRCLLMLGQPLDAEKNLILAERLNTGDAESRYYLAVARMINNPGADPGAVLGHLDVKDMHRLLYLHVSDTQRLRQAMTTTGYLTLAECLIHGGRVPDVPTLQNLLEDERQVHLQKIQRNLSDLEKYQECSDFTEAGKCLATLSTLGCSGLMIQAYQAYVLGRGGQPGEASKSFERLEEEAPRWARLYQLHGILLVETGLYEQAIPVLRKAASLVPDDAFVSVALVAALSGAGNGDEAWILLEVSAQKNAAETLKALHLRTPGMETLRKRPEFSDLMDRLRAAAGNRLLQ